MKKRIIFVLSVLLVLASFICVFAETNISTLKTHDSHQNIKIIINGTELFATDANGKSVEPFVNDGTTYVPIRAIAEAFSKDVIWDSENNQVVINDYFNKNNIDMANDTIRSFFQLYEQEEYNKMKMLITEPMASDKNGRFVIFNTPNQKQEIEQHGIAGMKKAEVVDISYESQYSSSKDNLIVFSCRFNMIPAELSTFKPDERKTSYLISVKKASDGYYISDIFSGY